MDHQGQTSGDTANTDTDADSNSNTCSNANTGSASAVAYSAYGDEHVRSWPDCIC